MAANIDAAQLTFTRHASAEAAAARPHVETIYRESYVEAIASGDPFDSIETFMNRLDAYTSSPTFEMVIAWLDGSAVGQTWGWPLTGYATSHGWWQGLTHEPEPGFTLEDGTRTFALSEIMVCRSFAGRGIAHALHNELLKPRREQRATLLVEPDNLTARRAYIHWGWQPVSQLRPRWDNAPLFDVFVLPLPIAA